MGVLAIWFNDNVLSILKLPCEDMSTVRKSIFCLCFALIIALPCTCFALSRSGNLPDFLDNGSMSYLDGKAWEPVGLPTPDTFSSGTFQNAFEERIAGYWPQRNLTLLSNAAIQRGFIWTSSRLFGTESYPTFYGSDFLYDSEHNSILAKPMRLDEVGKIDETISSLNEFASTVPQCRLFVFIPEEEPFTFLSCESGYWSEHVDYEHIIDYLKNNLGGGFTVIQDQSQDAADFYSTHFRTDHHWNVDGAYRGYRLFLEAAEISDDPILKGDEITLTDPMFGSYARQSLCLTSTPEVFVDYDFGFPDYEVSLSRGAGGNELLYCTADAVAGEVELPEGADSVFYDRYLECFPARGTMSKTTNSELPEGKNLLVIGDSFSRSFDRFPAAHYANTYWFNTRLNNESLYDLINEYDIDDVLLMPSFSSFMGDKFIASIKG